MFFRLRVQARRTDRRDESRGLVFILPGQDGCSAIICRILGPMGNRLLKTSLWLPPGRQDPRNKKRRNQLEKDDRGRRSTEVLPGGERVEGAFDRMSARGKTVAEADLPSVDVIHASATQTEKPVSARSRNAASIRCTRPPWPGA